jgi:hypothetical protein
MTVGAAQMKALAAAVTEVQAFMHKGGLTLADLIDVGGAELKSPNPKTREKARRVEKTWELMARLSLCYADLEAVPALDTAKPVRARRGEGHFSEVVENKEVSTADPGKVKSLKNNNKTDNHPVALSEPSDKGRWKHKRRRVSDPEGASP